MSRILVSSMFLVFCFWGAGEVRAQSEKTIVKYTSFAVEDQTQFILSNKYGDVICELWDKDSISVLTSITVKSKRSESLAKILNSVVIESTSFGNTAEIETRFTDNASLVKSYLGKLDPFNSNELTIHHQVMFPEGTDLNIINQFGNVMIEKNGGSIEVDLAYGDLRLEEMTGDVTLDLKTGRLIARNLNKADIKTRNYDIRLKQVEYLNLDTQLSETRIAEAKFARIDISGGELDIEKVETLKGSASNADITLLRVEKDLQLDLRNSTLIVEAFDEGVKNVNIDEVSSTIDLNISNVSFLLEADVEASQFSVPKSINNIERVVTDEKRHHRTISFSYEGGGDNKSKFRLTGVKGSFFLIED